jgi:RHS repeat-associated protein
MLLIWPVARAGGASFQYDNNGNMLQKAVDGSLTNFTWDYSNMLTGLTTGSTSYTYRYDGLLNRVATVTNSVEKRYITDRGTVLAETDTSGNITAYYVYGMGLIEKITPDEQSYTYHYDGTGSTIAMTDSNGNIVNEYAYDEFGNIVGNSETVSNPFKYVGQYGVMDDGNGLYYMRARYYDPQNGRFISEDPIGLGGGINQFAYASDNPVNRIDPHGLFDNPLPNLPTFSDSFTNSKFIAPVVDIVAGSIETGGAVATGVAAVVISAAGPEFWWLAPVSAPAIVPAFWDGIDRIRTGVERLDSYPNNSINSRSKSKCP